MAGPVLRVQSGCGDERNEDRLDGIVAFSAGDAWAVGSDQCRQLIEHWNGRKWKHVGVPRGDSIRLTSIDGASRRDIWAGGGRGSGNDWRPVIEHWNGLRWTLVPEQTLAFLRSGRDSTLVDVLALSRDDVRIVSASGAMGRYSCGS